MIDLLRRSAAATILIPVLLLAGCSLFPTTRKLPVPKAPLIEKSATADELVAGLNQRWAALDSLNASVEMQPSVIKSKEGVATDYTSIRGIILMRKPEMLRVFGRVPVIGTRAFDMVSDGKNFMLWIPSRNKAYKGSNTLKKKSANAMENLRPGFFLDALVVRGLEPDNWYGVVADSETIEDSARKHLFTVPEYILSISRRKAGSQELQPERVVIFNREDLLPSQQDLYDSEGNLETQVSYYAYKDFGAGKYPSKVVIKRPLEGLQVVLTVNKVVENQKLTNGEFVLEPTEGTQIENME